MKRYLPIILLIVLSIASCGKIDQEAGDAFEKISLNLVTPTTPGTRAGLSEIPAGHSLRYVVQVYDNANQPFLHRIERIDQSAPAGVEQIDIRIPRKAPFKVVVWADYIPNTTSYSTDPAHPLYYDNNFYKTVYFPAVSIDNRYSQSRWTTEACRSDNRRDAFFFSKAYSSASELSAETSITLKRPFALFALYTTQADKIPGVSYITMPQLIRITYPAGAYCQQINLLTGQLDFPNTAPLDVFFCITDPEFLIQGVSGPQLCFRDYVFAAPQGAGSLWNIKVHIYQGYLEDSGNTPLSSHTINNIPLMRNYQTNVRGNLLSGSKDLTIDVETSFIGDYPIAP